MHTDCFQASVCDLVSDVVRGCSNTKFVGRNGRLRLVAHEMQDEGVEMEEIGLLMELHSSYLWKMLLGSGRNWME